MAHPSCNSCTKHPTRPRPTSFTTLATSTSPVLCPPGFQAALGAMRNAANSVICQHSYGQGEGRGGAQQQGQQGQQGQRQGGQRGGGPALDYLLVDGNRWGPMSSDYGWVGPGAGPGALQWGCADAGCPTQCSCVVCTAPLWHCAATHAEDTLRPEPQHGPAGFASGTLTTALTLTHTILLRTTPPPAPYPQAAEGPSCAWARSGQGGRHRQLHRGGKRHSQGG